MPIITSPPRICAAVLAAFALVLSAGAGLAQEFCPGDVNHDGVVTAADVEALLPVLYTDPLLLDIDTLLRADVNDDGVLSGADIAAILALDGLPCPTPPPTPTKPPTPTVTPPVTPTPTATRAPTSTATPVCDVQQATLGVTTGTLSATDCLRAVAGKALPVDVYNITAAPGSAITVQLTTTAPLDGHLVVLDPAGQFESIEGAPPIQFTVTSGKPYQIIVTSNPASAVQFGDYRLTLTATACPTPVALPLGTSRPFVLDGTECPEPSLPTIGAQAAEPTDVYTFTVTDVPKNISITMQQLSPDDSISPALSLLGPDGYELVSQINDFDCTAPTGTLSCAQIRFLALQSGTYTILATGSGGTGRYSLTVASPTCGAKPLSGIPADHPLTCSGSPSGCTGTLSGNPTLTQCAAPLANPWNTDGVPEPSSPADVYSFTASPGDVISVKMTSSDQPHLYLLGPTPGAALVAEDDSPGAAELAATLAVPGTYTIVAANDNALQPDDTPVNYTLLVQKCPVRGSLNPLTGRQVSGTYDGLDCLGSGDTPYRSYAFAGLAGQLVTTTMTSQNVDSFVRLLAPDGSVVENDDNPFQATSDAFIARVLPVDGTYFVEVSTSPNAASVNTAAVPPPSFTVRARLCATTPAVSGQLSGTWDDADCELGDGERGDVFTFPAGVTSGVATISPPSNGCVLALLGDGTQVPSDGCSTTSIDVPVLGSGVHGFIVAGGDPSTRGVYSVGLSRCPVNTLGFGDARHGVLNGGNCVDADGIRADWYLLEAAAGLVNFNFGMTGQINAGFPFGAVLSDLGSPGAVFGNFSEESSSMFSAGNNLAAVLRVTGATPSDRGAYDVLVDPASLRQ